MPRKTQPAPPAPNVVADEQLAIAIPSGARNPKIMMITRSQIHPDPEQPREFADGELRASLATQGQLEPITVRPHPTILTEYMIVDGERRWVGAEGILTDLRCIVRTDLDDEVQRLAVQLVANTGKVTPPIQEAKKFHRMLQLSGMSVAALAEILGRAPSSVAERVALMELGPWLPLIEAGDVVLSHAVKVLLPLRAVPDKHHEHAIELLKKDYRWQKKGQGLGISLGDFENLIQQYYVSVMYPLAKSKASYAKQPEFNTAKHDAECGCGGIKFDLGGSGGGTRLCCGNPAWWRPLHRAALKAKKPAADTKGAAEQGKRLYLPEGTKLVKSDYGNAPRNVIALTNGSGRWENRGVRDAFDPADLVIDDAKLVQWKAYGDYPCVGTTDTKAVAAAQAAWKSRFETEAEQLEAQLLSALEEGRAKYAIEGPGVTQLVYILGAVPAAVIDLADALGLDLPAKVRKANDWDQRTLIPEWARSLSPEEVAQLLTALATVNGEELGLTSAEMEKRQRKALDEIQKRKIPWLTKPKEEKAPAAKTAPAKAGRAAHGVAFMKPMFPSPALAAVLGPSSTKGLPRTDVTKKIWSYIKKQGLQDQKNRRMINADEKLQPVFGGKKQVSLFEMTKLVNKHLAGTAEAAALIGTSKKAEKKGKASAPAIAFSQLSEETAELPLASASDEDDDLNDHVANAVGDLDDDEDGAWITAKDDGDDLWDSSDDELEEAEA
jgi:upstream activation factor subunit UAF30